MRVSISCMAKRFKIWEAKIIRRTKMGLKLPNCWRIGSRYSAASTKIRGNNTLKPRTNSSQSTSDGRIRIGTSKTT